MRGRYETGENSHMSAEEKRREDKERGGGGAETRREDEEQKKGKNWIFPLWHSDGVRKVRRK